MRTATTQKILIASLTLAQLSTQANAQIKEEDWDTSYGDKALISIATGSPLPIERAPAVATVITAQDIKAMNAKDLDDVLRTVPGLYVASSPLLNESIYSFRGIYTQYNPQALVLINGFSVNEVYIGSRGHDWGGLPLENVVRIEVIRGPGSALYGADAYAGVINIMTKSAVHIDGTEVGARVGSYQTRDAWFQQGGTLGPFQAAFYLRAGHSDGYKGVIEKDLQSQLDKLYGTHVSLAPGPISTQHDGIDVRTDLVLDDWQFRAAYQHRELGTGAGVAQSLDPNARVSASRIYLDLRYQRANWIPNWDLSSAINYYDIHRYQARPALLLFPPSAFGGTFPDGVLGNPAHSERHLEATMSTLFNGLKDHKIRLGMGYRIDDLYLASESKNFNSISVPGVGLVFTPLDQMKDVTGDPTLVYLQPHQRHLSYFYAQDEWMLSKNWAFTTGLRHDHYSDFGSTTNPRMALVWDAAYNLVLKVMYGQAFRAPSFTEQYLLNNPVGQGNPNLSPETIKTLEFAASWQPKAGLQMTLSLFDYHMRNIIRFLPNPDPTTGTTAQNAGDQTGHGFELETTYDLTRTLRLTGHYSYQHSIDEQTGKDAGLAPHRQLFARTDWRCAPLWDIGTIINYVADRQREPDDTRPPIANYTTVDLTIHRQKFLGDWDIRTTVKNMFNKNAKDPTFAPGGIPFDYPLPGRAFTIEFQRNF